MKIHTGPRSRRPKALVAVIAILAMGLTACSGGGGGDESTAPEGSVNSEGRIEVGISYPLSGGFDPMVATGAVTVAANWHVLEGLTELDPATRKVHKGLAAELPKEIDETHYEVDLRDGAVFHDGTAVTTEDVVYSFDRVLDPANDSLYAGFIDFLESVTAVDDDTVSLTLKYPFSLVNERLSVVKVVPKAAVEADYTAFNAMPIGTGPFKITAAVPDDKITFDRFDDYTGTRPAKVAGLTWNLLADSAARVTAMSSGTVQAIEDVPYIDVATLEGSATVESMQSFGTLFMMFDTQKEPFNDVRVRQAFFYALDMDKIIDTGLLGNGAAASSFLPETHVNYKKAANTYDFDPAKAKSLLAEAGADSLSITLMTTDTGWVADIAPLVKENLDAVGISTTLSIGQSGGQYTRVDNGEMEVMLAPGDPSVFGNDPDLLMRWWYGDNIWSTTRHRWSTDPKFTELQGLLDQAIKVTGSEQQELWNEAFDLISEEVPLYPILHRKLPTAWDDTALVGFKPLPVSGMSFLDVGIAE